MSKALRLREEERGERPSLSFEAGEVCALGGSSTKGRVRGAAGRQIAPCGFALCVCNLLTMK